MNATPPAWNILQGDWKIVKGRLKQKYGQLTDDDLAFVEGHLDEALGRIQQRTGIARAQLEKVLQETCGHPTSDCHLS